MKKTFSNLLLFVMLISTIPASAKAISIGGGTSGRWGNNVYWILDEKNEVYISGSGPMYDEIFGAKPLAAESVVIENGITTIAGYTFMHFHSLSSVTIPESITSIGDFAFAYCWSLKEIYLPPSIKTISPTAFQDIVFPFDNENLTIYCEKNSYAELWARNAGCKVVIRGGSQESDIVPGDINDDGTVDGRDLLRLAKFLAGLNVEIDEKAADLNGDGKIDGRDLLRLAKLLAGL